MVGAAADAVIGHRVAEAVVDRFLEDVVEAITWRLAERAPARLRSS